METSVSRKQYEENLLELTKRISDEQLPRLLQIVEIFTEGLQEQKDLLTLEQEFEEWDLLSDEALKNFEESLE